MLIGFECGECRHESLSFVRVNDCVPNSALRSLPRDHFLISFPLSCVDGAGSYVGPVRTQRRHTHPAHIILTRAAVCTTIRFSHSPATNREPRRQHTNTHTHKHTSAALMRRGPHARARKTQLLLSFPLFFLSFKSRKKQITIGMGTWAKGVRRLDSLAASVCSVCDFAASRLSRFTSSIPRLPTSSALDDESWTLYRSAALLTLVITALRLSRGYCFGNGVYLRRRVLLLAHIRAFVLQWEARCAAEVEGCCADVDGEAIAVLSRLLGPANARKMVDTWGSPAGASVAAPVFYGITSSIAFTADVSLEEALEVAYVSQYVLHRPDDLHWLRRFVRIVQYMVLRRLSMMEEVRLYAKLHHRVLFPDAHRVPQEQRTTPLLWGRFARSAGAPSSSSDSTACRPKRAWRLHRCPTWLVRCATADGASPFAAYLCLPLSYFPVEAVLPYTAAETWLNDRLVNSLLPQWQQDCRRTLQSWCASSAFDAPLRSARREAEARVACKVCYWVLHYVAPLLHQQAQLQHVAARRFCTERLCALAFPERRLAATCAPGKQNAAQFPCGSLRLLCAAACDNVPSWRRKCGGTSTSSLSGQCDSAEWDAAAQAGQRVRRALLSRALTQGLSITLQVCLPRLSLRHVAEMIAAGYCVDTEPVRSEGGASPVEALLRSLVLQMLWTTAAGAAEVFLQRWVGSLGEQLSAAVAADVSATLEANLLHVDEAFLRQWLRGSAGQDGSGSPSPPPSPSPKVRTSAAGSFLLRRSLSVEDVLGVGRRSGERVLAVHDAVVRRWLRVAVVGLHAVLTGQWRPLLGAVATAWADVPRWTSAVSVRVGYSLPQDVSRLLARRDESLPTRSPGGLRLLLELLAEDAETTAVACESRGGRRGTARGSRLPHPYLALLACASVWSYDFLLGEPHRSDAQLHASVVRIRHLHAAVTRHPFSEERHCPRHARDVLAALQDDARCIAYYSLPQVEQAVRERCAAAESADGGATARNTSSQHLHPLLDAEETRLLQLPSALAYLPEHVDYFDLFSLPYRFILRQLGLEMVFAYRTAVGMQQESRQKAEEWWSLTLFDSAFNPLTSALQEVAQLLASCGTILLFAAHWEGKSDGGGGWVLRSTSLSQVVQSSHTMDLTCEVLRGGLAVRQLEESLCPVQQLCECLPQATWSEVIPRGHTDASGQPLCAAGAAVSALQLRRREWRRYLAGTRPELLFDPHGDYVVGGLRLREGLQWHHVFFSYPQLCGAHDDAVRPTLSDVSFACPARGMTAVIGPSGAGKSSLNALLRRLYDPLPVVRQPRHSAGPLLSALSTERDPESVLCDVLRLALLDNALPPPPPSTAEVAEVRCSAGSSSSGGTFSLRPGYISLDGIPMALFSTPYLRQWFAWLPQTPIILPHQSFLYNVRVVSPFVTRDDARRAMQLCSCRDFVEDRGRTVDDAVGTLSGGEGQRLALARVVAGVFGRHRVEVLYGSGTAESEETFSAVGGLLLDEPTSRLDAANEMRLLAAVTALQATTNGEPEVPSASCALPLFTWIISHRMSSLRAATFMAVVENGVVTTTGLPQKVLQQNVFAQRQWQYQRLRGVEEEEADLRENTSKADAATDQAPFPRHRDTAQSTKVEQVSSQPTLPRSSPV